VSLCRAGNGTRIAGAHCQRYALAPVQAFVDLKNRLRSLPSNVSSRASALARDVAFYGATNVISQTQRPRRCGKTAGGEKNICVMVDARCAPHDSSFLFF